MNWDAVGAVAESLGAFGVIASVLYLAYEVRSNTRTMRADAGTRAQMEWAHFNFAWSEHRDRDAMARVFDPDQTLAEFSESERIALTFTLRSFAQQVEAQFFQYESGLLNAEVWTAHLKAFAGLTQFPAAAEWWSGERTLPLYTKSFIDCVAGAGNVDFSETLVIGINSGTATQ